MTTLYGGMLKDRRSEYGSNGNFSRNNNITKSSNINNSNNNNSNNDKFSMTFMTPSLVSPSSKEHHSTNQLKSGWIYNSSVRDYKKNPSLYRNGGSDASPDSVLLLSADEDDIESDISSDIFYVNNNITNSGISSNKLTNKGYSRIDANNITANNTNGSREHILEVFQDLNRAELSPDKDEKLIQQQLRKSYEKLNLSGNSKKRHTKTNTTTKAADEKLHRIISDLSSIKFEGLEVTHDDFFFNKLNPVESSVTSPLTMSSPSPHRPKSRVTNTHTTVQPLHTTVTSMNQNSRNDKNHNTKNKSNEGTSPPSQKTSPYGMQWDDVSMQDDILELHSFNFDFPEPGSWDLMNKNKDLEEDLFNSNSSNIPFNKWGLIPNDYNNDNRPSTVVAGTSSGGTSPKKQLPEKHDQLHHSRSVSACPTADDIVTVAESSRNTSTKPLDCKQILSTVGPTSNVTKSTHLLKDQTKELDLNIRATHNRNTSRSKSQPRSSAAVMSSKSRNDEIVLSSSPPPPSPKLKQRSFLPDLHLCSVVPSPIGLQYDMLLADPAYRHARDAGTLWQSIVGQHVRFPTSWWNGARSPPMGIISNDVVESSALNKWAYYGHCSVRKHPVLNQLVPSRAASGKLLLHIIVQDTSTMRPLQDVAIGCYHPNARGIRTSDRASRSEESSREVWIATRRRKYTGSVSSFNLDLNNGRNSATAFDKLLERFSSWGPEGYSKSPLGPDVRVTNDNVRAVFGETPPLETLFVTDYELSERLSDRLSLPTKHNNVKKKTRSRLPMSTHSFEQTDSTSSLPFAMLQEFVFAE